MKKFKFKKIRKTARNVKRMHLFVTLMWMLSGAVLVGGAKIGMGIDFKTTAYAVAYAVALVANWGLWFAAFVSITEILDEVEKKEKEND